MNQDTGLLVVTQGQHLQATRLIQILWNLNIGKQTGRERRREGANGNRRKHHKQHEDTRHVARITLTV